MLKVFSVYDNKALSYMQPFYFHNKGEALRAFEETVNQPDSRIAKHPTDYALWILGEFDEISGNITPLSKPEMLELATNCVKKV